jgi:predicted N-acetyltransferase YhbS
MWEAADVQWWWRRPRITDELALPVWFDDAGPIAAVGITAWENTWQVDPFVVPGTVERDEVWASIMESVNSQNYSTLQLLTHENDTDLMSLALNSGFALQDQPSGTSWMEAGQRAPMTFVDGFSVVDRASRTDQPHPMIARNGEHVEARLQQCSLYNPTLDLAVESSDGTVAGYALFWFDPVTKVGLLEPMRINDDYQRRGLAHMLVTHGLERLVTMGAQRLKVGFSAEGARRLYAGAGFVQTTVDRELTRVATPDGR